MVLPENEKQKPVSKKEAFPFRLGWTLATAASLILVLTINAITSAFQSVPVLAAVKTVILLFLAGLITGTLQWFVLRRQFAMASYWIAATSLGTIPSILVSIYSATFRPFYSEGALFSGAVLFFSGTGFLQWLFLRRIVRRAWLWLLAIAGALAFTFVITLMLILFSFIYGYEYNTAVSILMIGLLVGGSFGAFTGDALSRLLKQGI